MTGGSLVERCLRKGYGARGNPKIYKAPVRKHGQATVIEIDDARNRLLRSRSPLAQHIASII